MIASFLLAASAAAAQAQSGFAINAFASNPNTFDAGTAKSQFKLAPQLGLRFFLSKNAAIDFSLGGALNDQVAADSSTKTVGDPGARIFNAELGGFLKLAEYDGAYFGLLGDVGMSLQRWADFDNKTKPVPAYPSYATYAMLIPYVFAGMEPGYAFNPHFSLFSKFGMNLAYFPASKFIDNGSPDYNPASKSFPLKSRHDDNSSLTLTQMGLGVRFTF
jgi:opacity protein-like surface antigen